jgi:signal transduction histidine kinase
MHRVSTVASVACFILPTLNCEANNRSVDEIERSIAGISTEMESLPELTISSTPWTLGYSSKMRQAKDQAHHFDIWFNNSAVIDLIALIPTSYTTSSGKTAAFGFPERFVIERLLADGTSEVIIDYSKQDYTVTGIEPQLFHLAEPVFANGIRLTTLIQADNPTWWSSEAITSLSEVMIFSGDWNVALDAKVNASSVFKVGYVWSAECLVDGFSLFMPIKGDIQNPFNEFYYQGESLVITFDLGGGDEVDELRIWPVAHSAQHNFPLSSGIGFPREIRFEQVERPDAPTGKLIYQSPKNSPRPGSGPLMLGFETVNGRYFRLTMSQPVPEFRFREGPEIVLAEIEILAKGKVLNPEVLPVGTSRNKAKFNNDTRRLTDGRTSEGTILGLREWIVGLTQSSSLSRELISLKSDLIFTQRQERERFRVLIAFSASVILILIILIWLVKLIIEQRWRQDRDRIACDLHDEIGGNVSSLVHMTELIKETIPQPTEVQGQMLDDAIQTARLTSRETRNFVHFLESDKASLNVNTQIRKVAKQLLGVIDYDCKLDSSKLFKGLSSFERWDLIMFVKEALNNISKHAAASHVEIRTSRKDGHIYLSITDDGLGVQEEHLPLRHLKIRAKQLQADFKVESSSGEGTHIQLKLRK